VAPPQLSAQPDVHSVMVQVSVVPPVHSSPQPLPGQESVQAAVDEQSTWQPPAGQSTVHEAASRQLTPHPPPGHEKWHVAPSWHSKAHPLPSPPHVSVQLSVHTHARPATQFSFPLSQPGKPNVAIAATAQISVVRVI
jgi:hypothetical protein